MGALKVLHEPSSAAIVRHHMRADLHRFGVPPEDLDLAVLIASELVGNAVRHAAPGPDGMIEVTWEQDESGLLIKVTDPSAQLPRRLAPGPDEPAGRGLSIVEALADRWGAEPFANGKCVWAHLPLQAAGLARSA